VRERAKERLDQGQNIVIFPEGTTSDGRTLLPFRYGAFEIAMGADKPALPVAINYDDPETIMWTGDVPFFKHIIGVGKKGNIDVRLHIGKLIGPKSYKNSVEMSEAAWEEINSILIHFGMRASARLASIKWREFRLPEDPNLEAITDFMTRLVSLLVQVDSSTPPGERQICQILSKVLDVNGYNCRIETSPGGHPNLIATKGKAPINNLDKQKSYVVLIGNSDVVTTAPQGWEHPPFSGALHEGFIWGRGTMDMKGLLAVYLATFLTSKADAPVHFICVGDEERGGREGAAFVAENLLEPLSAKVVLGEGGFGITDLLGSEAPTFLIDSAEKASLWLRLTVKMNTSAHSATPPDEYPMQLILRAVDRATRLDSELMLLPVTEKFLATLSQKSGLISRIVNQALQMPIIGNQLRRPLDSIPLVRSMFRNTIAVTKITGAEAENVLAQQASATLDCRLLPGIHVDAFINHLNRTIHDERVVVERIHYSPHNETPFTDDNFRRLRLAIEEECPGANVTPILYPAHTTLGFFREKGIPSFGIFPALFKQDALNLIHGANERVSLEQLQLAYKVVLNFVNRYSI
jgi:acetylornithine deacetylase/succinyl-diaminopimelate desuccinylase-like protein